MNNIELFWLALICIYLELEYLQGKLGNNLKAEKGTAK